MSKTLYRTYRPNTFQKVFGQEHVVKTLTNAVKKNRIGHAYLFTGPRGTGKTTVARLLATAVNCTERENFTPAKPEVCQRLENGGTALDIIEIDAASHTGVDNIRELKDSVALAPIEMPFKVYIIDEVHMLSKSAFNALLKTLEEPPEHVIFILATTEIHKVPETIISRCQRFDFSRIEIKDIIEKLSQISKTEKVKIEQEALEMIAVSANGGMRDAESLFSQVISLEDKNITVEEVSEILGTTTSRNIFDVINAFANSDVEQAIQSINEVVKSGYNLETFANSLIIKLRSLLFLSLNNSSDNLQSLLVLTSSEIEELQKIAQKVSAEKVVQMIEECVEAANKIRSATIPQLPLEIVAVNICVAKKNDVSNKNSANSKNISPQTSSQSSQSSKQIKKEVRQNNSVQKTVVENNIDKNDKINNFQEIEKVQENVEIKSEDNIKNKLNSDDAKDLFKNFDTKKITENWKKVISEIAEENPTLSILLSQCEIFQGKENILNIQVKYVFHKDKLMQNSNRLTIEQSIGTIFRSPLKINVVIAGNDEIEQNSEELNNSKDSKVSDLLSHATQLMGGAVVK
ncbi:MAG: DNA polymerase III subunit gamma/tau [Candidatus Moranbacteria bacterium]|nr:DNA polymerase III subunit gamma/tau [Candidatus Moranbacteria bacterium]